MADRAPLMYKKTLERLEHDDVASTFMRRMSGMMVVRGVNTSQLAEELGRAVETLSRWRNLKGGPRLVDAVEICRILNVSLDWMCGITGDDPEKGMRG